MSKKICVQVFKIADVKKILCASFYDCRCQDIVGCQKNFMCKFLRLQMSRYCRMSKKFYVQVFKIVDVKILWDVKKVFLSNILWSLKVLLYKSLPTKSQRDKVQGNDQLILNIFQKNQIIPMS